MSQCVFCEATTNLNTQIGIKLDNGQKVTCDICDEHAEDATPKTVKVAYLEKQQKAEVLLEQLRKMGYNVANLEQSKSGSGLVIPVMSKPAPQPVRAAAPDIIPEEDLSGDDVVDTTILDSKTSKGMVSATGAASYGGGSVSVAGHASFDAAAIAANQLPPDQRAVLLQARKGKAKLAVVEGREGQPLVIAEKRVDGFGTTRIKITKKEDDGKLQGRFKKMAKDSIDKDRAPNFAREGYQNTQTECPICHGRCVIVQNNREISCPKCNGAGVISTY